MAYLIPNTFSTWQLSPEEEKEGSKLTITQKQCIQNHIAMCAQEKINIVFNTSDPQAFAQEEAYKRGQIDALQYLLDCSLIAEEPDSPQE